MDAKILTWKEARIIIDHYFSFWRDGEDKIWVKLIWHAIENAGLTIYRTDDEEIIVRSRIAILALIYQEFCARSQFSQLTDTYFQYLKEYHYKEILSGSSIDDINDEISLTLNSLLEEFTPKGLFVLMFESALRGSHGSLTFKQVDADIEQAIKLIENFGTAEYSSYRFLSDGGCGLNELESCSGLGYF